VPKYQNAYANDHSITFMPAIANTTSRLHAEYLRLLFWHAHCESEELFKLTGQLAQLNQDAVFSKRAAFFNSLKSKVGHIMAKASAPFVLRSLPEPKSSERPLCFRGSVPGNDKNWGRSALVNTKSI